MIRLANELALTQAATTRFASAAMEDHELMNAHLSNPNYGQDILLDNFDSVTMMYEPQAPSSALCETVVCDPQSFHVVSASLLIRSFAAGRSCIVNDVSSLPGNSNGVSLYGYLSLWPIESYFCTKGGKEAERHNEM